MFHTKTATWLSKSAGFASWTYAPPVVGDVQGGHGTANLLLGAVQKRPPGATTLKQHEALVPSMSVHLPWALSGGVLWHWDSLGLSRVRLHRALCSFSSRLTWGAFMAHLLAPALPPPEVREEVVEHTFPPTQPPTPPLPSWRLTWALYCTRALYTALYTERTSVPSVDSPWAVLTSSAL